MWLPLLGAFVHGCLGGEQPGSLAPSMAGFGTLVSIPGPRERELAYFEQWRALFTSFSILNNNPAEVDSPSLDRYRH